MAPRTSLRVSDPEWGPNQFGSSRSTPCFVYKQSQANLRLCAYTGLLHAELFEYKQLQFHVLGFNADIYGRVFLLVNGDSAIIIS